MDQTDLSEEEAGERLLYSALRFFLLALASPGDEAVGANQDGACRSYSVGCIKAAVDINQIAADGIDVQRETEAFCCTLSSLLPCITVRTEQQHPLSSEEVQRRDRLALSFEHKVRSVGSRLSLPLSWRLRQGKILIAFFPRDGSRAVAVARIEHDEIHRDPG